MKPTTHDSSATPSSGRRILVVDDEPTLRLSFGFALENEGYAVEQAAGGEEALVRLREDDGPGIDAMLLDLRMPGKGGVEVLRDLKKEGRFVPTVIVSAFIDSPTAVEAVDLGVTDFLRKPVTPDDIRGAISRLQEEEQTKGGDAVARARWFLRRGEVEAACTILAGSDELDADGLFWRMLAEHLRACREASGNEGTEFASSRFYQAADLLEMLAHNR